MPKRKYISTDTQRLVKTMKKRYKGEPLEFIIQKVNENLHNREQKNQLDKLERSIAKKEMR